jgi:carboxyl-terminal processing protease
VLNRKIKLDFYAQEDKIKAFIKANIAEQLFSPNLSAQIKGEYDSMLKKVKDIDEAVIARSTQGIIGMQN